MVTKIKKELSDEFIHAMFNIKLWQHGSSQCFGVKLIELIAKADMVNKIRLELGFKDYVNAYNAWYYKEIDGKRFKNDTELFEYVGVQKMFMKILQDIFMINTVLCLSLLEWALIAWIIQWLDIRNL